MTPSIVDQEVLQTTTNKQLKNKMKIEKVLGMDFLLVI